MSACLQADWREEIEAFITYGYPRFTLSGFRKSEKRFVPGDVEVNLSGRVHIVTGANSGLGFATAKALLERDATVLMLCRNKERGEEALKKLRSSTDKGEVTLHVVDVSVAKEIQTFTSEYIQSEKPLHTLVLNAGVMLHKRTETSEGVESNFATNVFGPFLLAKQLLPVLRKAEDPRVVFVSSGGMYTQKLDVKDLEFKQKKFDGVAVYAQNKRAEVILTDHFSDSEGGAVSFYSMHPGWSDTPGVSASIPGFKKRMDGNLRTWEQGADTIVWLCCAGLSGSTGSRPQTGEFYFDRQSVRKHLWLACTAEGPKDSQRLVEYLEALESRVDGGES